MLQVLDVCTAYLQPAGIPDKLAYIISLVYKILQIGVPILLVIWGMLDLGKAVMAQKEDEIKKGQSTFIKRLIAAAIVFFVFTITTLLVGLVADNSQGIIGCLNEIFDCKSASGC